METAKIDTYEYVYLTESTEIDDRKNEYISDIYLLLSLLQYGLVFTEEEWQKEWNSVLKLASSTPRSFPWNNRRSSSCCDSPVTNR